jgi:hypothetical protein
LLSKLGIENTRKKGAQLLGQQSDFCFGECQFARPALPSSLLNTQTLNDFERLLISCFHWASG